MRKNFLQHLPVILLSGVLMALLLCFLIQWTGYSFSVINVAICAVIVVCLLKVLEQMEHWHFNIRLLQLGTLIVSFVLCLVFSFMTGYSTEGNVLTAETSVAVLIMHAVGLVYVLVHNRKKADK